MKNKLSINELCYSTLSSDKPNSFDTYVSQGGYETWKKRWIHDLEHSKGERWHRVADSGDF